MKRPLPYNLPMLSEAPLTGASSRRTRSRVCLVAVLASVAVSACRGERADDAAEGPLNILVITLDTLRADHLSTYGYFRETSPNLDALAEESVVFDNCLAPVAQTLPSHASLFTGTYPLEHGATSNLPRGEGATGGSRFESTSTLRTLAEHLGDEGYDTGGFVSAAAVKRATGLATGFETWSEPEDALRAGFETERAAREWLARERDRPFFGWVHLFDCHQPFSNLPDEYEDLYVAGDDLVGLLEERGARLLVTRPAVYDRPEKSTVDIVRATNRYDGAIRYVDEAVGRIVSELRASGRLDDTLLIVTADHGEGLGQHDDHAHGNFWREQLGVPLIVRAPGVTPRRTSVRLSLVDVLPTAFSLSGNVPVAGFLAQTSGIDVLAADERPVFSMKPGGDRGWGIEVDGFHFLLSASGAEALYDLERDPHELENLRNRMPERADRIRSILTEWREAQQDRGRRHAEERALKGDASAPSSDHIEELNALGYGGE